MTAPPGSFASGGASPRPARRRLRAAPPPQDRVERASVELLVFQHVLLLLNFQLLLLLVVHLTLIEVQRLALARHSCRPHAEGHRMIARLNRTDALMSCRGNLLRLLRDVGGVRVIFLVGRPASLAIAQNHVAIGNVQGLVESETSLDELLPVDGTLSLVKLFKLRNDRHEDVRNVSWHGLDVDSVDTDAVVAVAIELIEDELQVHLLTLLDKHLALLVLALGIAAFVLVPDLFIFLELLLAVLDPIVILIEQVAPSHADIALSSTLAEAATASTAVLSVELLLALQLRLEGALRVEISLITFTLDLLHARLLSLSLFVKSLACGFARSSSLSRVQKVLGAQTHRCVKVVDLGLERAVL
eukprot:CAMPEP_0185576200 /NCGR_PEP_ID=MMETSP0434-20130131/7178_1 /TAXON_ID=626734 ORGANISM="Favella taraikaensis, Strain Fe Narragansett Bay" /NCGR_SAMPLE_ID=MMETSP0434 /ASSEMBLY_ACC=CAM_ASM_000379 /LENGTH=358 /DNA_ID=CAMNT_0028193303 /DNA_START=556 /DNA_END=1633 /DNA_ORIENTATION=-